MIKTESLSNFSFGGEYGDCFFIGIIWFDGLFIEIGKEKNGSGKKIDPSIVDRVMTPYGRCEFDISGESYKTDNLKKLFKKYELKPGGYHVLDAVLETDPLNPYDRNAVVVFIVDLSVGYIPKGKAKKVSNLLESNTKNGKAKNIDMVLSHH